MIRRLIYCLGCALFIFGCGSAKKPASSDVERYREDLSSLRPQYEKPEFRKDTVAAETSENLANITPQYDVTGRLNMILDSIDVIRKDVNYLDGFTIQVYSGTNSEEARLARGKVYSLVPDSNPILRFDEPNFKVKVGKFYSRIEAQKTYSKLKKQFPKAIIIPQRIYIQ